MAATATIKHGTLHGYTTQKCRCDECRKTIREYMRAHRQDGPSGDQFDRALLSDLLHELFPLGLTADAPARKARRVS